ncbi:SDR family oxidoreductase [Rhodococcus sp. NPDC127530]|uniref:SDR family oxidoreductase n=1 Tax=unclassified Rhodococcus (in: high G+C Gram-positive bacteria) TaxID=192944 RepID=UPI003644D2A6
MSFHYAHQNVRAERDRTRAVEIVMPKYVLYNEDLPVLEALRSAPAGRHAQPEELTNVALFLVTDEASFVHGAVYVADGGWTIRIRVRAPILCEPPGTGERLDADPQGRRGWNSRPRGSAIRGWKECDSQS